MDQIANMLISIKNGNSSKKATVSFPYSKVKHAIATCLEKAGYVGAVSKKARKGHFVIEVNLLYVSGQPRIKDVVRVSKPSRRIYVGAKELKPFKQGYGSNVLSTPKGILVDTEARKELVGGELLFRVW